MNTTRPGPASYRHVACCIDASEPSRAALEVAARICTLTHGRLRIVHVAPSAGSYPQLPASDPQSPVAAGEAHRPDWKLLRNAMKRVHGEPVLLEGSSPAAVACSWAGEEGVDLLVAAAHRGRLARVALGAFAGHLAQHAPCSALLVRMLEDGQDLDDDGIRHIACFVDASPASQAALDAAHSPAGVLGVRLSVVHVSTFPFALPLSWEVLSREDYSSTAHKWLVAQTVDRPGAEPAALLGFGQVPALACDWAAHEGVDLVVAAAHSGPVARLTLGSFTRYLAYHAPASVLVVRPGASPARDREAAAAGQRATTVPSATYMPVRPEPPTSLRSGGRL